MKAKLNRSVSVLGTGSYLPPRIVTNGDLERLCTNYDAEKSGGFTTWVDRVTHIHERRYIEPDQTAAVLAVEASKHALDMACVRPTELDLIIHASFTPSIAVPGDHVLVAKALGADATPSYTLTGACSGSVYGMAMAYGMLASGTMKRILVTGAETISPTLDYADPLTAIIFGDGAGAVVLGTTDDDAGGMLPPDLGFEFNVENIKQNNANLPFTSKVVTEGSNGSPTTVQKEYLRIRGGQSVLRNAVNIMARHTTAVLGYPEAGFRDPDLQEALNRVHVIPHQANGRIVDGVEKKLGIPGRVTKTIYKTGNISAASNLIALDYAVRHGNMQTVCDEDGVILDIKQIPEPLQKGDLVVLTTIGAGYLSGAIGFVNRIQ
ncbi:MAG: ketoacyl-ACP synthase III [Planctomycetota bacterium]|nr:ketoacyl-ACP synthase III [Planctomycetota bacterium]